MFAEDELWNGSSERKKGGSSICELSLFAEDEPRNGSDRKKGEVVEGFKFEKHKWEGVSLKMCIFRNLGRERLVLLAERRIVLHNDWSKWFYNDCYCFLFSLMISLLFCLKLKKQV